MPYKDPARQVEYHAKWHQANRETELVRIKANNKARALQIREYLRQCKDVPCADCGNKFPFPAMQFDHLGDKVFNLAHFGKRTWKQVREEVAKCEVVCANCHAIRTYERAHGPLAQPGRGVSFRN